MAELHLALDDPDQVAKNFPSQLVTGFTHYHFPGQVVVVAQPDASELP